MANAAVTTESAIDKRGEKIQPFFGLDLSKTSVHWYVSELSEGIGAEPAACTVIIPCSTQDENAFSVAFNPDGPVADIKQGTQLSARVRRYKEDGTVDSVLTFVGNVSKVTHDPARDALVVKALDGKDKLKDIRIYGRFVWSWHMNTCAFQEGWNAHFNPDGRPNCVFTPTGIPCFAPHADYGLTDNQEVPTPSEAAALAAQGGEYSTVACYWTLQNMLLYLRSFYGPNNPLPVQDDIEAAEAQFPEYEKVPQWIRWPEGFGSELDDIAIQNFDNAAGQNFSLLGGARKGRDIQIGGMSLFGNGSEPGILDMIFAAAGGWSWYMQYDEGRPDLPEVPRNIMVAVPTRWRSPIGGASLPYAAGGAGKDTLKLAVVTSGFYSESSENTITRVTGLGSLVKIETRVNTNYSSPASATLLPAWTEEDETAFLTACVVGGQADETTFEEAASRYPNVYTMWILNREFNFQASTDYSAFPRAEITRPIWPTLLSFKGNATGVGDIMPYPVRAEANTGSAYELCPEFNGYQPWDNGIIYMPMLRDAPLAGKIGAWRWTGAEFGVSGDMLAVTKNNIRMTMAIPCDHRLAHAVGVIGDPVATFTDAQRFALVDSSPDAEKFETDFARSSVIDLNFLYECWLRINSWPEPEASAGTSMATNKTSPETGGALRTDVDQLRSHVNRHLYEHFQLSKDGPITFDNTLVTAYPPGTVVNEFKPIGDVNKKPMNARFVIGRRIFRSDRMMVKRGNKMAVVFKNSVEHYPA